LRIAETLGTVRLAAGRIAIAALARVQDNPRQFATRLSQATYFQVASLGPLLCLFTLAGPFALRHVLGERWTPSLAMYPFIAAGVLVNSIYNLQASALFVLGQQWVVMRAFVLHVVLLGLGTLFLLPHLGIIGYGWAELIACTAYFPIHAGLARTVSFSYRRIAPLAIGFTALLFVPTFIQR